MPAMSKRSVQPDVAALLQSLREEVSQPGDRVRFHEADLVRRTSDVVTMFRGVRRPQPDLAAVLQALREQAHRQEARVRFYDVGTVQQVGDGVATLSGLPRASTDELVTFPTPAEGGAAVPTGVQGLILNLDHARVDVILLGPDEGIRGGDLVTATGERLRVPVGEELLGRVVNPLGEPLDGQGAVGATTFRYLEREAPGIVERVPVDEPLHTGLKIVDALVPIGRGQRELIVGDRQTGKTTLAVDAILNQRDGDVRCVYVATGQKKSSTLRVIETLRRYGALGYTIVVVSGPDDPPALRYLAPYAGCTMAESLMHEGRDVLIVYDDLSKHADAYRELSLLLRRPPGREAYPGDIFYLHARLLERACKLGPSAGGGSLTALPIVEMQRGNLAAYIPTNLISISDGQIVLDSGLFNRGVKPAVNVGQSISRVGGAAQTAAMREVAGKLRLELAQFEEVARFVRFGAEVDEATRRQIRRGERFRAVLRQPAHRPLSLASQVIVLLAATEGYLDAIALEDVPAFERMLLARFEAEYPTLDQHILRTGELGADVREALIEMIADYGTAWLDGLA
jgi:F-type H+-transporting ATPase subunit alpha